MGDQAPLALLTRRMAIVASLSKLGKDPHVSHVLHIFPHSRPRMLVRSPAETC